MINFEHDGKRDAFSTRDTTDNAKKISGKQVALIVALGAGRNLYGDSLLEYIEFECDVNVVKLEDITVDQLPKVITRLEF